MKTTSSIIVAKKIAKLNLASNSIVGNILKDLKTGVVLRPVYSQGSSWKQSTLVDKSTELESVLRLLKIEFSTGNDSPRGGKTGYFVKINTKIKN
jgi:hypothetical protein